MNQSLSYGYTENLEKKFQGVKTLPYSKSEFLTVYK